VYICVQCIYVYNVANFFFKYAIYSGFGGLGVAYWPLVPKFAGSNPAEIVGFLRAKKSSARLPSEGKLSRRSHVVDLRHVKDP
jgi:hypothetical protein